MTSTPEAPTPARRLYPAVVLGSTEDSCTVVADGQVQEIGYAVPFPRPRADRVSPGHLVAVATAADGTQVAVWRWFDAVVVDPSAPEVALWEPLHGHVQARPREPRQDYRPGSRAYLSAGLPGADWWVAGPVLDGSADVELDAVEAFFTEHELWDRLT
jgi:hypothetical protein